MHALGSIPVSKPLWLLFVCCCCLLFVCLLLFFCVWVLGVFLGGWRGDFVGVFFVVYVFRYGYNR